MLLNCEINNWFIINFYKVLIFNPFELDFAQIIQIFIINYVNQSNFYHNHRDYKHNYNFF